VTGSSFLGKRYYVTFALWPEPSVRLSVVRLSVVCLSSVTFVRRAQMVELFANILHRLIAQGLGQFVLKFLEKIPMGSR